MKEKDRKYGEQRGERDCWGREGVGRGEAEKERGRNPTG